ncbi:NADH dehydrogenase FAD-containing subunit [Leptospira kmetyi]|uniref:NADH dehydrogenase FAD-containing subunit n=3 Tax=Leptospira kmetyi TaxID=408139 RepID=A0A5F1XTW7_9LEPT|nr:NADH dehydrogenase FAD-containing subunit [Leptospira kmetyi]TGK18317.1 NADH dehydrogenase FAD-containing subunit [Leptospira kmetyi]TGK26699.1 NADH dehydrogenase FAD-containing subunit [Leptospira kmetyi]
MPIRAKFFKKEKIYDFCHGRIPGRVFLADREANMSQVKTVLIAGGGYAGIVAANRLVRKKLPIEIVLVTAQEQFQERIRNHQLLAGTLKKTYSVRSLLHKKVKLVIEKIAKIETKSKRVLLENGSNVHYDHLIYTLGIQGSPVETTGDSYVAVSDVEACAKMHERIKQNPSAKITVLGAGLSGIETAAELAKVFPKSTVTLVDANVFGKGFSDEGKNRMIGFFSENNVEILENTKILKYSDKKLLAANGGEIDHDFCVLANGLTASKVGSASGLRTNPIGQVYVNQFLEVEDHPEIIGAGDCVQVVSSGYDHLRMACATALPMGVYAAERLSHKLGIDSKKGKNPFSLAYLGRNVSLGREDAVVQESNPDDSPTDKIWTARSAKWIKELICKFTILSFRLEKSFDFYFWKSFPENKKEFESGTLATETEK